MPAHLEHSLARGHCSVSLNLCYKQTFPPTFIQAKRRQTSLHVSCRFGLQALLFVSEWQILREGVLQKVVGILLSQFQGLRKRRR